MNNTFEAAGIFRITSPGSIRLERVPQRVRRYGTYQNTKAVQNTKAGTYQNTITERKILQCVQIADAVADPRFMPTAHRGTATPLAHRLIKPGLFHPIRSCRRFPDIRHAAVESRPERLYVLTMWACGSVGWGLVAHSTQLNWSHVVPTRGVAHGRGPRLAPGLLRARG